MIDTGTDTETDGACYHNGQGFALAHYHFNGAIFSMMWYFYTVLYHELAGLKMYRVIADVEVLLFYIFTGY